MGRCSARAANAGMMGAKLTDKNSPNTNAGAPGRRGDYNLWVDPMLALGSAALPMPRPRCACLRGMITAAFRGQGGVPKRQKSWATGITNNGARRGLAGGT